MGCMYPLACVLHHLGAMDSLDSPLVWHLLTSWQPAWSPNHFDRPQTKLRKGNVFTPVCQSFCSRGGGEVSVLVHAGIHPQGRHPPWTDTPWQTPPLGRHPRTDTPRDGYCSGRYASYWNTFLSIHVLVHIQATMGLKSWIQQDTASQHVTREMLYWTSYAGSTHYVQFMYCNSITSPLW